jgi:hypothetical protein
MATPCGSGRTRAGPAGRESPLSPRRRNRERIPSGPCRVGVLSGLGSLEGIFAASPRVATGRPFRMTDLVHRLVRSRGALRGRACLITACARPRRELLARRKFRRFRRVVRWETSRFPRGKQLLHACARVAGCSDQSPNIVRPTQRDTPVTRTRNVVTRAATGPAFRVTDANHFLAVICVSR